VTGKNLKNFEIILSAGQQTVTAAVRIASRDDITSEGTLTEVLNELNDKYKMVKFSLDKTSLIVRADLPKQRMDKEAFIKFIEHTKGVVDESYPKIHPHLSPAASAGIKPPTLLVPPTVEPQDNAAVDPPMPTNPTVDTKPVALNRPEPDYTETARSKGVQGIVRVRVLVGEDGLVKNVRIMRGLPDGLNDEAVKAANKMRFRPAMKDGQAVRYWVMVDIKFNLR
jgi:TonB family protein